MTAFSIPWIEAAALARGLHYEPEADERWLRAWEPYTTIRIAQNYSHALLATGNVGSLTLSRMTVLSPRGEFACWCAIVQDARVSGSFALTNDRLSPFAEASNLITVPRFATGHQEFDAQFTAYSRTAIDGRISVSPSLRKLLLRWNTPVHLELRAGGFILLPTAVRADAEGLHWMLDAVKVVGDKAVKGSAE
jgi:hypothetical protein